MLFVKELSKRLSSFNTKVVSLHPGVIFSSMPENAASQIPLANYFFQILKPLIWILTKTEYYGAQTTLTCCFEDFNKLVNGGYYKDNKLTNTSKQAQDQDLAEKLWNYSAKAVKLEQQIQK